MSSLLEIHKLEDRYPFTEEELEILLRCHRSLGNEENEDSFLMKLAMCSPYSYFFLPGDELRDRVTFIEDYILPAGFPNELKAAISADPFVEYANAGEDKTLERFLEGIADTGRRGPHEVLRVLHKIFEEPEPHQLIDLCFRLSVAADVIVAPSIDKDAVLERANKSMAACKPISDSLEAALKNGRLASSLPLGSSEYAPNGATKKAMEECDLKAFTNFVEESVPLLSATLSIFVHNLLFHGHDYPDHHTPYIHPKLDHESDIFRNSASPLLFPLACTSYHFGGKWHRLYSSEMDGRSFNRLEWAVLAYGGPSLLVIKTEHDAILGAFASMPWKQSPDFYGDSDCFVFQLQPTLGVYRPTGKDDHFMYCNPETRSPLQPDGRPHGIGFGGSLNEPRLFLPESLEVCSAHYLDRTFKKGDLLPKDELEKFKIKHLEVWGIGGDEVITNALRMRAEHRETADAALMHARTVKDKSRFLEDLSSGVVINKLYDHREQARGRAEFVVDNEHKGAYKLERTEG